jgi:hypothetical protein
MSIARRRERTEAPPVESSFGNERLPEIAVEVEMKVGEGVNSVHSPEVGEDSRIMRQLIHDEGSGSQQVGHCVIAGTRLHSVVR